MSTSTSQRRSRRPSFPSRKLKSVVDIAKTGTQFSTFVDLIKKAGLSHVLNSSSPLTVFAPINSAFDKLNPTAFQSLLKNADALKKLLLYHVVSGRHMSDELVNLNGKSLTSVQGDSIPIQVVNGQLQVGNANVVQPDVKAANGVIHVIDAVLIPSCQQVAQGSQGSSVGANYQAQSAAVAPGAVAPGVLHTIAATPAGQAVGQAAAQAYVYQSYNWLVWIIIIIIIILLLFALISNKPV